MTQQTGAIYHQGILYSGGGGTEVIPNPQGEATDTLNTVEIDGTIYGIEGGGTEVTPNPQGTATDTLNTVEIDGTVYNIESGEGSDVTITPTLNTGQKLADYSIDGTSGAIYMPTIASGDLIINPSETPTDELTKIGVSSSIEDAYLANGKIATSAGYYITCPLDKTLINGTYTVRVRDGASTYNFEVTYSGSTITKSWSSGSNNYTLTITSTTAGMSYYSGDYRNIYCDIVMMIPQIDVYSVSGGGGGSNLILDAQIYSLEEQVVGIWTDGKPLYQKTVHLSALPSTAYTITTYPHGIQDIDTICGWDSVVRWSTGAIRIIPSTQYVNRSENIAGCFDVTITKTGIEIWVGQDRTALNGDVTIWYTKTTDTAGSGGYQAYGFSPIIYSDTEREVGVWRDNKPLYQKSIVITSAVTLQSGSWVDIATIENVANVVRVELNRNGDNAFTVMGVASNNKVRAQSTTTLTCNAGSTFTFWYTKNTDVAGSSDYNTLAIPNVHYSTDEQVIGTWIDGKPIYQKTLVYSSGYDIGSSPITLPTTDFPEFSSVKIFINGHAYRETTSDRGTACVDIGVWKDGSSFKVQAPDTWRIMTHFTVQYTKTTD